MVELQEVHDETLELDEIHSGSLAFPLGTSLGFKISMVTSMRERTYLEVKTMFQFYYLRYISVSQFDLKSPSYVMNLS